MKSGKNPVVKLSSKNTACAGCFLDGLPLLDSWWSLLGKCLLSDYITHFVLWEAAIRGRFKLEIATLMRYKAGLYPAGAMIGPAC